MSLNDVPDQAVQIGIAPTIGLLANRILGGVGWNLQAIDQRPFYFISIRLLSADGGLGSP